MLSGRIATAALAGVGLLAWSGSARAGDDVMTLKGGAVTAGVTVTLGADGTDADTELVSRRGGGFSRGGYRGGYAGYRGGYRGYYGGYRGGYRGYYGGYRGYYGGYRGYYRPYYYGGYYRPYYYGIPYVYPVYGYSYYPCSVGVEVTATQTLVAPSGGGFSTDPNYPPAGSTAPQMPQMPPPRDFGADSYPYDGGPQVPVPMPGNGVNPPAAPTRTPPVTVPLEGRLVSLPGPAPRPSYPAYGERR